MMSLNNLQINNNAKLILFKVNKTQYIKNTIQDMDTTSLAGHIFSVPNKTGD
jgi:hypothetical protein